MGFPGNPHFLPPKMDLSLPQSPMAQGLRLAKVLQIHGQLTGARRRELFDLHNLQVLEIASFFGLKKGRVSLNITINGW